MWRVFKYLFQLGIFILLTFCIVGFFVMLYFKRDLPDHNQLASYRPATVTRLYTSDGTLLEEYATQKRLFVPINAIPTIVQQAFISAEDRNFYHHFGLDPRGIARALVNNVTRRRSEGASTITQQVVKNMLLSSERTMERKLREAIIALRMSYSFSKDKVLELYLNEIYLGNGSYGVAAAALNYFDKSIDELTIEEAAMLASLPKAPNHYNPWRAPDRALERRNLILRAMHEEEYISDAELEVALATPINLKKRRSTLITRADFFAEDVRRALAKRYGNRELYEEGLVVHTTLDQKMQVMAERAFRDGLVEYDRRHGYHGPIGRINMRSDWHKALQQVERPAGMGDWNIAAVLGLDYEQHLVHIGLDNGRTSSITFKALAWALKKTEREIEAADGDESPKNVYDILNVGDVIIVAEYPGDITPYALRQIPRANGAMVVMDPHTGRVLAMVGGFTAQGDSFNRATQAMRQPGSAFKPFVYLTALEEGYRPNDLIADEPIEFEMGSNKPAIEDDALANIAPEASATAHAQGEDFFSDWFGSSLEDFWREDLAVQEQKREIWSPRNHSGNFYGPTTLRRGLEKSLNVMTIHLALLTGLDPVIDTAKRMGIHKNPQHDMSTVLGAAQTNVLSLTNAYAMLINGGKRVSPHLIDRIQDRNGKTIYRGDRRLCEDCRLSDGSLGADLPGIPQPQDVREQVVAPEIAYQMVSILEGVVLRGTAQRARALKRPLAGKTGTTNNSIDAWFVGATPDLVVGVYVGYDRPRSLGKHEEGSSVALPIFVNFMEEAMEGKPAKPFRIPPEVKLVRIDAASGFLPSLQTPDEDVILEAFIPGQEPTRFVEEGQQLPVINADAAYNIKRTTAGSGEAQEEDALPGEIIEDHGNTELLPEIY